MTNKTEITVVELKAIIELIGHLSEEDVARLIGKDKAKILNEFYFTRRIG